MDWMERAQGIRYDILMLLQPTCPIRKSGHIDEAVELLWASDLDTLASVKGPIYKRDPNIKAIRNGVLEPYNPAENRKAWEPCYVYNASIYAMKRNFFLCEERFVSQRSVPIVMDRFHSADIDEEIDLLVAELYVQRLGLSPFTSSDEADAARQSRLG
jgi:CMP-N-acetylneuraminic acid synthetase